MNLRERCQTVFQAGYQFGQNSFRAVAQKTDLSKSSVHRLYHRIVKRNQHPESELWESSAGQKWIRLLVLATIFIFALQGGIAVIASALVYIHLISTTIRFKLQKLSKFILVLRM